MGYRSLSEGEIYALSLKLNAIRDKRQLNLVGTVVSIPDFNVSCGDTVKVTMIYPESLTMKIKNYNDYTYTVIPINSSSIEDIRINNK